MKILDLWYVLVWLSKIVLIVYLFTSTDMIFTEDGTGYYPILLINDYWNLYQEYMPLNDTVK